jgi:N-acetylgalactosamine 4-sulfate 6-O-sulfotransferase
MWPTLVAGTRVRLRCLPYFHVIGVDKAGTTDLWDRLIKHPQIVQNSGVIGKETHWWSWRRFGEKAIFFSCLVTLLDTQ